MHYIKQLDALRAFAVILVIISHWASQFKAWKLGEMGVDIFFVLSGFLISYILFVNKNKYEEVKSENGRLYIVRNFMVRRVLRIFPLYFLIVFIHYLLDDRFGTSIRDSIAYHVTYTSNFYFVLHPRIQSYFGHLWSLSVEEQFYLFWPWLVLFVDRSKLFQMILVCIIAGTLFSFVIPGRIDKLMPACMGSFGLGALLAYWQVYGSALVRQQKNIINYLAGISLVLLALYPLYKSHLVVNSYSVTRILVSIITFRILFYFLYENKIAVVNRIANDRSLAFIGKISYGIYLVHTLIPPVWDFTWDWLSAKGITSVVVEPTYLYLILKFIIQFLITVLVAYVSWKLFESPILSLKRFFEYDTKLQAERTNT